MKNKYVRHRRKKLDKPYLLWSAICLTVAGIAAVLVFILKDGIDVFLSWFTGKYAAVVYIGIAVYLAVVITAITMNFGSKEVDKYVSGK